MFSYRETTYIPDKALKTKTDIHSEVFHYVYLIHLSNPKIHQPTLLGGPYTYRGIAPSFTTAVIMISPQTIQGLDSTVFSDPDYQFVLKGSTTNCCLAPRPDNLADSVDYYIRPASNGELLLNENKCYARFHVKQVALVTLPCARSTPVLNN